jgi:hypothetical protein
MKQFFIICLFVSSISFVVTAQAQVTVSIGPKVGGTLSKMRVDGGGHADYRYGFAAGAQAYVGWGCFALQPALLFLQKGYQYTEQVQYSSGGSSLATADFTTKQQLNYLTLPVNFTFAPEGTASGPQFFAGPYVSVLLGGHYNHRLDNGSQSQVDPIHIADKADLANGYYARRFDAGLQAGLGFRAEHLLLQIDYSLGLRSTVPDYTYLGAPANRAAMYNSSFLFAASYLFDIKH